MKTGISTIKNEGQYGMPVKHIKGLITASQRTGAPICIRPVSPLATSFLEQGFPTKPLIVKNKSSQAGICAGLIPAQEIYGSKDPKHQEKINQALTDPTLKLINLQLTKARLFELESLFKGSFSISQKSSNPVEYQIRWEKEGKIISVYAQALDKTAQEFSIVDGEHNPIQVLGKTVVHDNKERTEPITADYDLLVVCSPHATDDRTPGFSPGDYDKAPIRTQGLSEQTVLVRKKKDSSGEEASDKKGNLSPRIVVTIEQINKAIEEYDSHRVGRGVETVHHGAEFNNPGSFSNTFLPALMVLPQKMDLSNIKGLANPTPEKSLRHVNTNVVLIETIEEMQRIRMFLQDKGYYWPAHTNIPEIEPFRRKAIQAAREGVTLIKKKINAGQELRLFKPKSLEKEGSTEFRKHLSLSRESSGEYDGALLPPNIPTR